MVNINVGVLGHVDSGKTSLCRALSQKASTAAFDKNPQSQQRGITIDLGFSTFSHPGPHGEMQFTLVDCPGHASLIKTVIGKFHPSKRLPIHRSAQELTKPCSPISCTFKIVRRCSNHRRYATRDRRHERRSNSNRGVPYHWRNLL